MTAFDAASNRVTVEPWPDRAVHPVLAEQALAEGYHFYWEPDGCADEDDPSEEPPSDYSRAGILETDLSSLQDLRIVAAAAASGGGGLVANGHATPMRDTPHASAAQIDDNLKGAAPADESACDHHKSSGEASKVSQRNGANGPPPSPAVVARSPPIRVEARRGLGPPRPGAAAAVPSGKGRLRHLPNICHV